MPNLVRLQPDIESFAHLRPNRSLHVGTRGDSKLHQSLIPLAQRAGMATFAGKAFVCRRNLRISFNELLKPNRDFSHNSSNQDAAIVDQIGFGLDSEN